MSEAKKDLLVDIISPLISATVDTLKIQAETEVKPLKPYLKKDESSLQVSIAGAVNLVGSGFQGTATLCFSKNTFLGIYENMFDEKHDDINEEIEDAAGELLNIIYGAAKADLNNNKGYSFQAAVPTVMSGDKLPKSDLGTCPVIVLPFDTPFERFYIEIKFDSH